ncbi:MAG: dihydroorotate dehydrogenase-like protein [Cyclobacteriaceae bacterium]|nr:dihydroorotate dehydrogenase-like protein [Cyclobacteriaceae bacterium]
MADLKTRYCGLTLKNPIVVGASNLVTDVENLVKLEKAGAAAIVYKSLFEEQIQLESLEMESTHQLYSDWDAEHDSFFPTLKHGGPAEHLLRLRQARNAITIPLIGSLNCVYQDTWVEYAQKMAETGIDALELNFYASEIDFDSDGAHIVNEQLEILKSVRKSIRIPVIVKLSPFYTNPLSVISKMDKNGASGFVLFNRLFQPDIDIDKEIHHYPYNFSSENDNRLALRYAGLLYGKIDGTIISNTGILSGNDVIKMLLAGADAVQVVSAIYKRGIHVIETMLHEIERWMEKKRYPSINEFKGRLSRENMIDPFAYKRAQYVDILMRSEIFMQYHPKRGELHDEREEL